MLRRLRTAAAFVALAAGLLGAPTASAQYTCTQNTALASVFSVNTAITCQVTSQATLDACMAPINNPSTPTTILKVAPGTYTLPAVPFLTDVCIEVGLDRKSRARTYALLHLILH